MFTGIVEEVGKIVSIDNQNDSSKISIKTEKILKIPKQLIKKYGAVSFQCCLAMVNKLSTISKAKVCISITGIAGPKGGTKLKPVGLVYIGIKVGKKVIVNKCNFKNNGRSSIQKQTVKKSLYLLLKLIK